MYYENKNNVNMKLLYKMLIKLSPFSSLSFLTLFLFFYRSLKLRWTQLFLHHVWYIDTCIVVLIINCVSLVACLKDFVSFCCGSGLLRECSCSVLFYNSEGRILCWGKVSWIVNHEKEARKGTSDGRSSELFICKQDTLKASLSHLKVMFGMPRNQNGKPLHE